MTNFQIIAIIVGLFAIAAATIGFLIAKREIKADHKRLKEKLIVEEAKMDLLFSAFESSGYKDLDLRDEINKNLN